jgi:6-phosphogluconolactonase
VGKFVRHDIRVFDTFEEVSRAAALNLIECIRHTLAQKNLFSLVLSGGQTPRRLYELLATEFREMAPWPRVRFYMGDERFVQPDDPRSNFKAIKEVMLSRLPVDEKNIFAMPTGLHTAEQAAISYENILRSHYEGPWPIFDLVLLGMGADCHTASLFPNSPALNESGKWVSVGQAPEDPRTRLTLTLSAINHAETIFFLITGKDKAKGFKSALGKSTPECPASMVRSAHGRLSWWVDESAARLRGK